MVMTAVRLISPGIRSSLLVATGCALMLVPFMVGLSVAATVTGFVIGTLAVALGLAGTEAEGRGTLPVSAHAVYDRGLALGLLLTAVIFGLDGQHAELLVFGAAGLGVLVVALATIYSANRL
jgi:hypothetical protein